MKETGREYLTEGYNFISSYIFVIKWLHVIYVSIVAFQPILPAMIALGTTPLYIFSVQYAVDDFLFALFWFCVLLPTSLVVTHTNEFWIMEEYRIRWITLAVIPRGKLRDLMDRQKFQLIELDQIDGKLGNCQLTRHLGNFRASRNLVW